VKNCVAACNKEGLMKHLEKQQKELEICEKALAEYMESKRRAFPRFYFVSSADLLDILSNGNNPIKVMQHMNKCFQVRQSSESGLFTQLAHCHAEPLKYSCVSDRAFPACLHVLTHASLSAFRLLRSSSWIQRPQPLGSGPRAWAWSPVSALNMSPSRAHCLWTTRYVVFTA